MKEIFEIAFVVAMNTLVAGSMITIGLNLTISQIIEPFKNVRMVALSLIANFLFVPLFAFAIVSLLPISEGMRIGIILLSLSSGAPFIPMLVKRAKGPVASGIGLMLLLLVVTIFLIPIVVPIIFSGTEVSSIAIAQTLIFTMLIPLLLALFIRAYLPNIAQRIQPFSAIVTNIAALILVITVAYLYTQMIVSNLHILPIILLFFLGCLAIGYLTGWKNRNARIVLSVGTSLRNPPVAILVASNYFSNEPMAAVVPMLVVIMGLSILFSWAIILGKKTV